MSNAAAPELIRAPEVARLLSVSVGTVYKLAASGALPAVKVGTSLRFRRDAIDALLASGLPEDVAT